VNVPLGESRTIELQLLSDEDTSEPWHVDVADLPTHFGGAAELAFTLDRSEGKNGDRLELTIERIAAPTSDTGATAFVITNTLGDTKTLWAAYAGD